MAAMLGVAFGRGSRLKMIIIWIHNTSLCGGEYVTKMIFWKSLIKFLDMLYP